MLKKYAKSLKDAGLDRLNISLNTLKEDRFKKITPCGNFSSVFEGIEESKKIGFNGTKINVVLIRGINDDEVLDFINLTKNEDITIRFIEFMPIGNAIEYFDKCYLDSNHILSTCPQLEKIADDGVSVVYKYPGFIGKIGLIKPISDKFCKFCNRIRITSDCKLRLCLHNDYSIDLKGKSREDLKKVIKNGIMKKFYSHNIDDKVFSNTNMNEIGG